MEPKSRWSEEDDCLLRDSWRHLSATQIGVRLGRSRNSVIGRAHRLKLPAKEAVYPKKSLVNKPMADPIRKIVRSKKTTPSEPPVINSFMTKTVKQALKMPVVNGGITIEKLLNNSCRYITGKNKKGSTVYCGVTAHKGSWCKQHYDVVFDFRSTWRR